MRVILAIIIAIIILLSPHAQIVSACVIATSDLVSSLADAQSGSHCLDIPAGTYAVSGQGVLLNATADNMEIRGTGEGKTIIQVTSGLTLTQDLIVFRLAGIAPHVHDLTISIGTGYHGSWGIGGLLIDQAATHAIVERVEVVGGYSSDGARGYAIGTYRAYDRPDGGAAQYATIRDCFIHDGMATGIGVNSNNNSILNNHIVRVGLNGFSHGIYAQGGNNLYQGNIVENATGYSFHGHKQVPSLDGSGDRYIGNLSINPGLGGIVINSTVNGANPGLPAGAQLTRYATISGNTFRNTAGKRSGGIWCNGVPCVIDANVLEDTYTTTGAGWIEDSGGSIITNNLLTALIAPDGPINSAMIRATGTLGATIANNRVTNNQSMNGIRIFGSRHSVQNNTVLMSGVGGSGIVLDSADMALITGNRVESTGGAYTVGLSGSPPTNLTMTGNYFKRNGALFNINLTGITGSIRDNIYDGTPQWLGSGVGVLR